MILTALRLRKCIPATLIELAVNAWRLPDPCGGDCSRSSQLDWVQFDEPIVEPPRLEGNRDTWRSGIVARLYLRLNGNFQSLPWLQVEEDFLSSHFPMGRVLPYNLPFDWNVESRWHTQARVNDLRSGRLVR